MLRVSDIDVFYGRIQALDSVSLEVSEGSMVVLLGNNGAGKSTTLRTIAGLMKSKKGTIELDGKRIDGLSPDARVKLGLSLVPEGRQIFPGMTVRENLLLGAFVRNDKARIQEDMERVQQYFPILRERQSQRGGTLSGGEQQMLAIARGLLSRPRILLLDEPSLGLSPKIADEIFQIIRRLNREEKLTILLVEQKANIVLPMSDAGYILQTGRIVLSGPSPELMRDEDVKTCYLGE